MPATPLPVQPPASPTPRLDRTSPWWWWVCLTLGLGGCATAERSAERHTDANRVQAEAMNQQLLLNIVRARGGEAMHFSRIPEIALPLPASTLGSLAIPFGVGTKSANTITGQIGASTASARVVPQDSQEFMQGIQQPVAPTLLGFYLDQGWPKRLVLSLFIEQIVVRNADGQHQFLDGHPASPVRLRFYQWLDALGELRPTVQLKGEPKDSRRFGPALPASAFESLSAVLAMRNAGWSLEPVEGTDRFQAYRPEERRPFLSLERTECLHVLERGFGLGAPLASDADPSGATVAGFNGEQEAQASKGDSRSKLMLTLRSPMAMIYYLGELARHGGMAEALTWEPVVVCPTRDTNAPTAPDAQKLAQRHAQLFPMNLRIGEPDAAREALPRDCSYSPGAAPTPTAAPSYVSVEHRGCRYAVHQQTAHDLTAQAMRLVGEVLQLQYKGLAAPATVRIEVP